MFILRYKAKHRYLRVMRNDVRLEDIDSCTIFHREVEIGYKIRKMIKEYLDLDFEKDFIKQSIKITPDDSEN